MDQFHLSYEQLAWRRFVIRADFRGDLQAFQREHPATPEQAFTAAARNRFSIPDIQRMPIQRQARVGELGMETVGIEERIVFRPGGTRGLRIYRMPEKSRVYACGADPSGGSDANDGKGRADPDWAVAQIGDPDTGEQCATLRLRCMPGEFGRYLYRLLRFYNMAQVALERTGAGVGSLEALLNCNYPVGFMYHRAVTYDQDPLVRSDKLGWNTDDTVALHARRIRPLPLPPAAVLQHGAGGSGTHRCRRGLARGAAELQLPGRLHVSPCGDT